MEKSRTGLYVIHQEKLIKARVRKAIIVYFKKKFLSDKWVMKKPFMDLEQFFYEKLKKNHVIRKYNDMLNNSTLLNL